MDFIKSLSPRDRQEFTKICMEGSISSIVKMYDFISRRQVKGREIEIATELIAHYKKVKGLSTNVESKTRQELNQFTINRTAYNPHNNLPYIPGSSIKGAPEDGVLEYAGKGLECCRLLGKYLQRNESATEQDKYHL